MTRIAATARAGAGLILAAVALTGCRTAHEAVPQSRSRGLGAGFRFSVYGPRRDPGPRYWARVGQEMAGRFPGATP